MKRKNPFFQLILIACLSLFLAQYAMAQREIKTINSGWLFSKGVNPDSSDFSAVSIPHTWNTDAYIEKGYYRGTAWYQKTLTLSEQWKDKQLFLRF